MIPALSEVLENKLKFLESKWEYVNLTGKDGKTCLVLTCVESELSPYELIQSIKDDATRIERMAKALEYFEEVVSQLIEKEEWNTHKNEVNSILKGEL